MGRNIRKRRYCTVWNNQIEIIMFKVILSVVFFLNIHASNVFASEIKFLTIGTARARALAIGSAYHSIEDDFSSGLYNPAAFKIEATHNERKFRLLFNPVAPSVAFYDYSRYNWDFEVDNKLTFNEILLSTSMFLKGAVYTSQIMDLGLDFGEEIIEYDDEKLHIARTFTVEGLTKSSFHSAFINVKIAPPVSIGFTGTLYNSRIKGKRSYKGGYIFGVLLVPNPKLNLGIAYNKIPDDFSSARMGLESIENDTVTSGISYYPDEKTVLSIDLRNLNRENQLTAREIHTGIERIFGERIALRAGYYRKKTTKNDIFSIGIGILPTWVKINKYSHSTRNDIFSYTFIMEDNGFKRYWHVFSLFFRC